MPTTSMVSAADRNMYDREVQDYGEVGFREIAKVGWGRLWRRISGEKEG